MCVFLHTDKCFIQNANVAEFQKTSDLSRTALQN